MVTELSRPTAAGVWQEYKDALRNAGRLTENEVVLLRWVRPRWDGGFRLVLDYAGGLDLERLAAILKRNVDVWNLLPYNFDFAWGESYKVEADFPVDAHRSDLGNAQRLVTRYGADLRYCHPWREWLVWDGRRWKVDDTAEVVRRGKATIRAIYAEAAEAQEAEDRKALAKWALQSEANTRIKAMLALAESEPGIPILPEELDADPWLLTVSNGVLDLRTGELLAHDQNYFNTKLAPVDYDPLAEAPRWLQFLDEIMAGDEAMITFLQRAVGYSLTGDTSERVIFILHGCGANGKSTFLEMVRALLGDYAQRIPTETLLASRRSAGAATPDIARLKGARFVSASESEEGRRLAEATIKDLTGGDTITARFLYGRGFDFQPRCKIWLATNHRPEIRGTDRAVWDRVRLVPFGVVIPEEQQDKHLVEKLKEELPGILAWAIEGCLAWQQVGLGVADKVTAATAAYRNEQDVLGGFVVDCCLEGPDKETLASDLYEAYKSWGGDLNQRKFGLALGERGFTKERKTTDPHKGRVLWRGLGLVNLNAKVNDSEPVFYKTEPPQNHIYKDREKGSLGSLGSPPEDGSLAQAALGLGGEARDMIVLEDGTRVPF